MKQELIPLAEELLVDTVRHYNSSNRAEDVRCQYLMTDGRRCAAGRMMTDEGVVKASSFNNVSLYLLRDDLGRGAFLALFHEKWRPLLADDEGMGFTRLVQNLHDVGNHWGPFGLSASGHWSLEHLICKPHGLPYHDVADRIKKQ